MGTKLRRFALGAARGLLRVCVIAAVMMGVSHVMERLLRRDTFDHLARAQRGALAAVESIRPMQFKSRYVCALLPSVELTNLRLREPSGSAASSYVRLDPPSSDCRYTLSELPRRATASGDSLPPPVVGHWAEGMNGLVGPFTALLDTAWHLIVQPSFFATLFAISAFAIAALLAGLAMAAAKFTWHPYAGATIFAVGTIALACVVAWCLQGMMEGGLYLFGRITSIAGLCCGGAGIAATGYAFFLKTIEVRIHEGVDELIPH